MNLEVGIVGASIAGLMAAGALGRQGARVTLFERSTHLEERGSGIMLEPPVATRIPGLCSRAYTSRRIYGSAMELLWEAPVSKCATSWNELYRALRAHVPDHLVRSGTLVTECTPDGGILLADGTRHHFDLVIGADGIGSTARHCVDPDFEPVYLGYVAVRGMLEADKIPREGMDIWRQVSAGQMVLVYSANSHAVMYAPPGRHNQNLNWMWYHNVEDTRELMTDRAGHRHPWSLPPDEMTTDLWADLMARATIFPSPLVAVMKATPAPYLQGIFHGIPGAFARGRVALIGDAAHVSTPHRGAASSIAFEDASSLTQALAEGKSLAEWSEQRRREVTLAIETARTLGESIQFGGHAWDRWSSADFEQLWKPISENQVLRTDSSRTGT